MLICITSSLLNRQLDDFEEVSHPQNQWLNTRNCLQGTVIIRVAEGSGTNEVIK